MNSTNIKLFLLRFKNQIQESGLVVIPTKKNRDELAILAWVPSVRRSVIENLTEKNYCEGPLKDQDGSKGEIWVFGYKDGDVTIYIKLKLDEEAKCLSFHMAEYEMKFPFA